MAVFLDKALYAGVYGVPGCGDCSKTSLVRARLPGTWSCLFTRGVAAGCQADPPLSCPTSPTKRKQMAAFLVKNFGLELYGPD